MVVERIKQIIDYKKISTRQFCIEVGVANGFLDKVKDVGSEKLLKILNTYPELSPEWLLTGKGKMLKEEVKEADQQDPPAANNDKYITLLEAQVKDKEAIIKEKEEKEAMYKEKIMALENELQEYKNLKKGYQQEEEEEDEIIEILPMAAEPASIPAELLKAKQGEYRRI